MSVKKLKKLAKERGFKVSKKATKEDLIDALTSEDDEDEE